MLELLIDKLIIPYGQSFLYDISKSIYQKKYDNNNLERKLRKAVEVSVQKVMPFADRFMCDEIVESIVKTSLSLEKVDITQIVKNYLFEWGEENYNPQIIAAEIYNTLQAEIMAVPELCVLITYKMQQDLILEIRNLRNQFKTLQTDISKIYKFLEFTTNDYRKLTETRNGMLLEIMRENSKVTQNIKNVIENSKFIASAYQSYFTRPLFLEKRMADGEVATLYDVYIENKFYILDFEKQNSQKVYEGILQFITDFVMENLKNTNYGTTYTSMSSTHINVLFIKGHPGSGKSSLFYYLAYLKSCDINFLPNYKFYFIKLIELYDANDGYLDIHHPLKDMENQIGQELYWGDTVLVLDGLDEICVAKNFDINEYCYNLIRNVSNCYGLKVIITTRLNYIKITHNDNKNVFNIQLCNLDISDLRTWVEKYFSIHKSFLEDKKMAEMNIRYIEKNENGKLIEILAIPLLFYMIVVSKMDISQITSIGELYDYVFKELRDRNYNEEDADYKQKHGINKRISEKLARQIAIEISKKMYDNKKLLLDINSNELRDALNKAFAIDYSLNEEDKKEIERLFPITFFYKEAFDVVEFAHKSIMEFFVAEKMYQALNDYDDVNEYIETFMLEPIISNEILDFYSYFIKRYGDNIAQKYSDIIKKLKKVISDKNIHSNKDVTFSFEMHKVIFKIYWYFIKNIICCNNEDINDFINEDIIRRYILGILSINDSGAIAFLDNSVIKWNFKDLVFKNYNFSYCNLQYAEFAYSSFEQCIFMYSNLSNANLYGIKLNSYLLFVNCNMNGIELKNLQLDLQNERKNKGEDTQHNVLELRGVSLDNAQFSDMDLRIINFVAITSMYEAKLKNIKLNLKQLLYFAEFKILYQDIKIFISLEDFTTSENREIRKLEKSIKDEKQRRIHTYNERMQEINELKDELKKNENNPHNVERIKERLNKSNESLQKFNNRQEQKIRIKEEEAVKYLMDIVVKKLKKNSLQQSIIDSLKLKFDENDFYHSYFFYS